MTVQSYELCFVLYALRVLPMHMHSTCHRSVTEGSRTWLSTTAFFTIQEYYEYTRSKSKVATGSKQNIAANKKKYSAHKFAQRTDPFGPGLDSMPTESCKQYLFL